MKRALYIIFIIAVFVITLFHMKMFITNYRDTKITKSEFETANIYNNDGSYLMLLNPRESVGNEDKAAKTQKSILITVPYDLKGARYIVLDGYYTKLDYQLKEYPDAVVTQINLYNSNKNEKLTLEYNAGRKYEDPKTSKVDPDDIPKEKMVQSTSNEKISLSKDGSYVEIPDYFEIVEGGYSYEPVDFIQFTNISSAE